MIRESVFRLTIIVPFFVKDIAFFNTKINKFKKKLLDRERQDNQDPLMVWKY